ncbi:23243_t:CDS:2 [Rhizophagus irregularis]|nr:23243_t:CDS:2 [Rhizophagus irregularis]
MDDRNLKQRNVIQVDELSYVLRCESALKRRTRALLDKNEVLILRSNEKFLTWKIPSAENLEQQHRNLNAFQLFRLHYFKTLFNNSKHRSIKASKLNKIHAEINEAWNDSEIIQENYQLLRQNTNDPFTNQFFNGSSFR